MENNLSYQDFQKHLLQAVSQELSQYGTYQCELMNNQKNNVVLTGVSIRHEDSMMAPVFYLEKSYQSFLEGKSLHQISQELVSAYRNQEIRSLDPVDFMDYEKVKDKIRVRLVSKENNKAYYKQGPYRIRPMGAEVLYVELERQVENSMFAHVTNAMAEQWKVPKTELFDIALENTQSSNKVKFRSMDEIIHEMLAGEDAEMQGVTPFPSYVLSNERGEYGATVVLYPNVLGQVREQLRDDYYILPSSLHELIILPKKACNMEVKELRSMVREINQQEVMPEEVLGNEIYEFNGATNKVKKCVKEDRER